MIDSRLQQLFVSSINTLGLAIDLLKTTNIVLYRPFIKLNEPQGIQLKAKIFFC